MSEDNGPGDWLVNSKDAWPLCDFCDIVMENASVKGAMLFTARCPACFWEILFPSCRSCHRYCAWEILNPIDIDESKVF